MFHDEVYVVAVKMFESKCGFGNVEVEREYQDKLKQRLLKENEAIKKKFENNYVRMLLGTVLKHVYFVFVRFIKNHAIVFIWFIGDHFIFL